MKIYYDIESDQFGILDEEMGSVAFEDSDGDLKWLPLVPTLIPVFIGFFDRIILWIWGTEEQREAARKLRRERRHIIRLKRLEIKLEKAKQ